MTYSRIHQEFATKMNDPRVLTNPEDFLGSNYLQVLDLWRFAETLHEDEIDAISGLYWDLDLDQDMRTATEKVVRDAAEEVLGWRVSHFVWSAVYDTIYSAVFGWATRELIANVENKVFYDLIMNQ
jgi:hypothetical protein